MTGKDSDASSASNKNWSLNDRSIRWQKTDVDPDRGLRSDKTETLGSHYQDPQQEYPQSAFHKDASA